MSTVINTNIMSLNAQFALTRSQNSMATSLERLSSGLRINRASDDAAGLAVAQTMTKQIRGQEQALRNVNDGISYAQVGEAAFGEIQNLLQRMNELAVQKENGTYSATDIAKIDAELAALNTEITRQAGAAEFNGISVNTTAGIDIAVDEDGTTLTIGDLAAAVAAPASTSITDIGNAIEAVSVARAKFGADINTLESTARNLQNSIENLSAARSGIQDADFAKETANLTRTQILQQAGVAMLAQANSLPSQYLGLLR